MEIGAVMEGFPPLWISHFLRKASAESAVLTSGVMPPVTATPPRRNIVCALCGVSSQSVSHPIRMAQYSLDESGRGHESKVLGFAGRPGLRIAD